MPRHSLPLLLLFLLRAFDHRHQITRLPLPINEITAVNLVCLLRHHQHLPHLLLLPPSLPQPPENLLQARAQFSSPPRPTRRREPPSLRRLCPELDPLSRLRRPNRSDAEPRVQQLEVVEESGNVEASDPNTLGIDVEDRIPRLAAGRAGNVAVAEDRDEDRRFSQGISGEFQGEVDVVGHGSPGVGPEAPMRDLPEDGEDGEVEEDAEVLGRGGAPVGEAGGDGEAFAEDGAEVGREGEVEEGLDGGEFDVGEAGGDGDAGGAEVGDEAFSVGGEREADELLRRLSDRILRRAALGVGGVVGGENL